MIWLWITVTALALITALGILVKTRHPRLGWTIVGLAIAAALVFAVSAAVLWSAPDSSPELEADYALLLGCSLRNGQATPELVRRCQTALDWLEAHPHGLLVVSGGDPGHQGVTEAAVMAAWLRNHGANAKQILLEDQASDTRENLLFSKTLVEGQERETDTVLIITSEYHQTRARFLAEAGGQTALGLSCRTPLIQHLLATVREVYCMANELLELAFS